MKRFSFGVGVAVVAALIVTAITGVFPFSGGGSGSTSVVDSGNSTTSISGNGSVGDNSGSITNNFNEDAPKRSDPAYGRQTEVRFEVENEPRGGGWELYSPAMNEFSSENEPPDNGYKWLPEDTIVEARCALAGTSYSVKFGNDRSLWRFFVQLEDGKYLPVGDLREATHDGPQGLRHC